MLRCERDSGAKKPHLSNYIKQTFDMYDSGFRSFPNEETGNFELWVLSGGYKGLSALLPPKSNNGKEQRTKKKARHGRFDARGYGFDTSVKPSM